jgi:origin recognition complex subunit 3
MCHFYANPLSVLNDATRMSASLKKILRPEHYEAIRMLPSFRKLVESLVNNNNASRARGLLEDDDALYGEIEKSLDLKDQNITKLLRALDVLSVTSAGQVEKIELYLKAFKGTLSDSDTVRGVFDSTKRMTPEAVISFINTINGVMETGSPELDLEGWRDEETNSKLLGELEDISIQVSTLVEQSAETGKPIRSSYTIHSKGLRTTVIAQKVQLSYEKSTLSKEDIEFTALIDRLSQALERFFTFENPQDLFLNEVWLYDSISPYKDVFTPRPRFAIERALFSPQDYLDSCEADGEALSASKPATAILYQMYLESGTLVNISDIWTAFFSIVGGDDGEGYDERTALMLFYRGLTDLKLLGMVKQCKKKVDHLAKSAWKGL